MKKRQQTIEVTGDSLFGKPGEHDLDAEKAVLSAILLDQRALDRIAHVLRAEHFYSASHGAIFEALLGLRSRGVAIDTTTVSNELKQRDRLHAIGDEQRSGLAYVIHILDATPSIANVETHARLVIDLWRIRSLQQTCLQIAADITQPHAPTVEFIDDAESRIFRIANSDRNERGALDLEPLIRAELGRAASSIPSGVSTGIPKIDELTGGFRRGETWIVGGRPGMGKTAMMLAMARAIGSTEIDGPDGKLKLAAFFQSIEMTAEQLPRRLLASEARVSILRATSSKLSPAEHAAYTAAGDTLRDCRISIDDTAYVTPSSLRARLRRAVSTCRAKGWNLFAVFVDYIQRMHGDPSGDRGRNREREVAECMTAVAETAKELGVVAIVGAQLSRDVEKRSGSDLRPKMGDLRESGQLEQDAQQIVLLHRPEAYFPDKVDVPEEMKGYAEGIFVKVRDGATGVVPLGFEGYCTRFHPWAGPPAKAPAKTKKAAPSSGATTHASTDYGPINETPADY
jgi:replicative DNA helicase